MWNLGEHYKLMLKGKRNNNAVSCLPIDWEVSRDQLALSLNIGIFRTGHVIIVLATLRFQNIGHAMSFFVVPAHSC